MTSYSWCQAETWVKKSRGDKIVILKTVIVLDKFFMPYLTAIFCEGITGQIFCGKMSLVPLLRVTSIGISSRCLTSENYKVLRYCMTLFVWLFFSHFDKTPDLWQTDGQCHRIYWANVTALCSKNAVDRWEREFGITSYGTVAEK